MNYLSNVIKDASGRVTSWFQGTLQYRVLRDAQGKPLQVTQFPKDPYNGVMGFKYNPDGTLESVKDLGLIDPVITNVLKEEALNKGGVGVTATTSPGGGTGIKNILSLTQAQYDAIVTKDAATLYVIVEG